MFSFLLWRELCACSFGENHELVYVGTFYLIVIEENLINEIRRIPFLPGYLCVCVCVELWLCVLSLLEILCMKTNASPIYATNMSS